VAPESAPLTNASWSAFMTYLASSGFQSETNWFVRIEPFIGQVNAVASNATAFVNRNSLFTIQFWASAKSNSFPSDGIPFLSNMVASIEDNNPADWAIG
jgi:hypothetical protein